MPAVMAKYNPFAEKAGMQKIVEQLPPKEAVKIAEILKAAFIKHNHARFMKYFFCHMPFGRKKTYAQEVKKQALKGLHT